MSPIRSNDPADPPVVQLVRASPSHIPTLLFLLGHLAASTGGSWQGSTDGTPDGPVEAGHLLLDPTNAFIASRLIAALAVVDIDASEPLAIELTRAVGPLAGGENASIRLARSELWSALAPVLGGIHTERMLSFLEQIRAEHPLVQADTRLAKALRSVRVGLGRSTDHDAHMPDVLKAMLKDHVAPRLREIGFKGSGNNFRHVAPDGSTALLNFQGSKYNDHTQAAFFLNCAVWPVELWRWNQVAMPALRRVSEDNTKILCDADDVRKLLRRRPLLGPPRLTEAGRPVHVEPRDAG